MGKVGARQGDALVWGTGAEEGSHLVTSVFVFQCFLTEGGEVGG